MSATKRWQIAAVIAGLAALALASAIGSLFLDKADVFAEIRGSYAAPVEISRQVSDRGETRRLRLTNDAGHSVADVLLRVPAELAADYRIWILYAGAKTGDRILDLVPDRPNVVLVAMQYPYRSPDEVTEYLRWPYDIRHAAFRAVAGGMLVIDHLEQEPRFDIERIVLVGISVGVPFATMLGALDTRVPKVLLVHGGGDLAGQVMATQEPRWSALPASLVARALFHSFEPLRYVHQISPREVIVIAARDESMLPKDSVDKLFAAALEPKKLIWTESDHVRSRNVDTIAEIVRQIDLYVK